MQKSFWCLILRNLLIQYAFFKIKILYSTLSIPQNDQHFPKFVRRLNNCNFLFSKFFQNFTIFYNFLIKRAIRGLFDYYGIVSQVAKQKKVDLVRSKFKGVIFCIKSFEKKVFQDLEYSKIHRWLDKRGLDNVEYSN